MPKSVMEALGLSVTKPYHDLYAFDSRAVKCIGVIKDLVVNLTQVPMKSILMDIVVADISPKFGMLLSTSWEKKVGGLCRWISCMLQFQYLGVNSEDYTEKFKWHTW